MIRSSGRRSTARAFSFSDRVLTYPIEAISPVSMLGGNYAESNCNFGRDCRRHVVLCPRGSSLQRQHRTRLRTWRAAPRRSGASSKEPRAGTPDARGGMGRAQFRSAKDYHHRDEPQADAEELVESGPSSRRRAGGPIPTRASQQSTCAWGFGARENGVVSNSVINRGSLIAQ